MSANDQKTKGVSAIEQALQEHTEASVTVRGQMKYVVMRTEQYHRRAATFIQRHPDATQPYVKTLQLLEINPHPPGLRLHALQGRLSGLYRVSIPVSFRITLEWSVTEHEIVPINIGTHDEVY